MKTWPITGVSSGFGRALAKAALEHGDRVIGTLRSEAQRDEFSRRVPGHSYGVTLDVTAHETVISTIADAEYEIGAIDVLVNNAGYGHEGTIEESTLKQYRRQFDVNVFGAISAIQAVLPFMRARRAGHIINITSMGGLVTFPGLGVYHGSKFALEGISETMAKGRRRTDWAGRSMVRAEQTLSDYNPLIAPLREARLERNGKQAGDPAKPPRQSFRSSMLKILPCIFRLDPTLRSSSE
jgi:NAD(P)-dependent dehydrogenase (short-subunit alcohol dehydrogenase family)